MTGSAPEPLDISTARRLFPATERLAYLNTAAVGLASTRLTDTYREVVDAWARDGFDFVRGEAAANAARASVARLMGADSDDVALIPSVSSAAGLVAAQLGPAGHGQNVVIGEREYSSNHFPWRQLAHKGYDVRQVPFRGGGLEPDDVASMVDGGTQVIAFSGVQTATGHRSDIAALSGLARAVGALVFVDGSQLVGALDVTGELEHVDVLVAPDHKFLLHAGRGLGYCYLSKPAQDWLVPVGAGWRAGRDPLASFFGPDMDLSDTASRFDSSISWLAAFGEQAALSLYDDLGAAAIYTHNAMLRDLARDRLTAAGWPPVDLPAANRSTIVSVPLGDAEPAPLLAMLRERFGVICAARDGHLRVALHFYNDEDDIDRLVSALTSVRRTD